jgi:hypothetical protein
MFRFSIRELFMLAAIVALAIAWQLENRRKREAVAEHKQLRSQLKLVQTEYSVRIKRLEALAR